MKETDQLKKLMEAVDPTQNLPDRNEPWEYNIEEFRRELKAFANELPDAHYRDWLLLIINDSGVGLMDKVKAFANELPDAHYSDWLLQITKEFNNEGERHKRTTEAVDAPTENQEEVWDRLKNDGSTKKFAVSVAWSQTDHETYLVSATDRKDAERVAKEKLPGINHVTGAREIVKDLS